MKHHHLAENIAGFIFTVFGLFIVFFLIPFGVVEPAKVKFAALSPSYYPRIVGGVLIFLGIFILLRSLVFWILAQRIEQPAPKDDLKTDEPKIPEAKKFFSWSSCYPASVKVLIVFAIMAFFYTLLPHLGFVLASLLALFSLLMLAGERKPVRLTAIPLITPLSLHFFFTKLAGIPIPNGILAPLFHWIG